MIAVIVLMVVNERDKIITAVRDNPEVTLPRVGWVAQVKPPWLWKEVKPIKATWTTTGGEQGWKTDNSYLGFAFNETEYG